MKEKKRKAREAGPTSPDESQKGRSKKKATVKVDENAIWFSDMTADHIAGRVAKEEAAAKRAGEMANQGAKKKIKGDGKDPPSLILKDFLTLNPSVDEIVGEVHRLELARSLDLEQKFKAIFEAIFDMNNYASIKAAYTKYAELLQQFTPDTHSGKIFIGVFEDVMCRPGLRTYMIPRSGIYFKGLYDLRIVSEESIMEWYQDPAESALLVSKGDAEEIKDATKVLADWFKQHETDAFTDEKDS